MTSLAQSTSKFYFADFYYWSSVLKYRITKEKKLHTVKLGLEKVTLVKLEFLSRQMQSATKRRYCQETQNSVY